MFVSVQRSECQCNGNLKQAWVNGGRSHDSLKVASVLTVKVMEIQTSVAPSETWLRDDLEEVYALLFRFLGYGFRLATGWLVTQKFVIPSASRRGRCCSTQASLVTVVNKTHHHLPSGHVCSVELVKGLGCARRNFPRSAAQCVVFPFAPSPITSPSAAEAARGGEQEGRHRLNEEVLDAPEELRQLVVGVGGAQEEQGQERLALCTSLLSQDSHVPWSSRGGTRVS